MMSQRHVMYWPWPRLAVQQTFPLHMSLRVTLNKGEYEYFCIQVNVISKVGTSLGYMCI